MKKFLSLLLTAVLILSVCSVAAVSVSAASGDLTLKIGATSYVAYVGDTFTYSVVFNTTKKLSTAQIEIPYDSSIVQPVTASGADYEVNVTAPVPQSDIFSYNRNGKLIVGFVTGSPYTFGASNPIKVKFKVLAKGTVDMTPSVREVIAAGDVDLVDINGKVLDATFSCSATVDLSSSGSYALNAPRITAMSSAAKGVSITWEKISGAPLYRVFRMNSGKWAKVADTTSNTYVDTTANVSGTEYTYTIRIYDSTGKTAKSDYIRSGWTFTYIGVPAISGFESVYEGLKVKWGAVAGAERYRVFKKVNNKWATVGYTNETSIVDPGVVSGAAYTYTVRCVDQNDANVSAYDTAGKSGTFVGSPVVAVAAADGGVTVKWAKVTGAVNYRGFRKTASTGWAKVGDTTAVSLLDKTAVSDTTYYYTVRCLSSDAKKYTSGFDPVGKSIHYIAAPAVPTVAAAVDGVTVKWTAVEGAPNYRIFRKTGSGGWAKIADTTETTYTDTAVTSGTKYTYTIRVINADASAYLSAYNTTGKAITYIAAPAVSSIASAVGGVSVKWAAVTGAVNYRVFRKTEGTGWKKVGDTTATSILDKTAVSDTTYIYTVRCLSKDAKSYTSSFDPEGKSYHYIATPNAPSVAAAVNGVTVKWTAVAGAPAYRVFRKTGSGGWAKLVDTTEMTITDTAVASGTKYTYTIRVINEDATAYLSAYNTTGKAITYIAAPAAPTLKNTSSGVQITWAKVNGAAKYRIFRKTGSGGWAKLADTTAVSYVDKTAVNGTKYSYTIRCLSSDGTKFTSAYNATGSTITCKK